MRNLSLDRPLPPIFPVVLYHGRRRWRVSHSFQALIEDLPAELAPYPPPEFRYHLCDLTAHTDEEIRGAVTLRTSRIIGKLLRNATFCKTAKCPSPAYRLLFENPEN